VKTIELETILRRILAAAIVAPMAAAACGGATSADPGPDGGAAGDAATNTSVDAGSSDVQVSKPDGGRFKDASAVDARMTEEEEEEPDADIFVPPDAGDPNCVVDRPALPDAGQCMYDVIVKCDEEPISTATFCDSVCVSASAFSFGCSVVAPLNGDRYLVNCYTCGVGRRPEGFTHDDVAACASPIGEYFTIIAELEAASVRAFERLEQELRIHGAPDELASRARRAARDEVRHADVMGAFARAWGGTVKAPAKVSTTLRPLDEVLLENAVEGCVRETFGALTATLQAERASDPRVRGAMRRIAADETEHAALAWSVARWADAALDAEMRARIASAMERAIDQLEIELDLDVPREVRDTAGLPSRTEARAMLASMRANLWGNPALAAA
jgi:hypothetical protein